MAKATNLFVSRNLLDRRGRKAITPHHSPANGRHESSPNLIYDMINLFVKTNCKKNTAIAQTKSKLGYDD